jgi:hypothetical protein
MIRVHCPSCEAKLNAKEELAGQTRKCPKCGTMLRIPETGAVAEPSADDDWVGLDDVAPDQGVRDVLDHEMPRVEAPTRLGHLNRYLICDKTSLFATWEDNGNGWMLKTNAGLIRAKRNPDRLPSQGDFTLVELMMEMTDEGLRLRGIRSYEIAQRWALCVLEQDDHSILDKIVGPGCLNRDQKAQVWRFLHDRFMRAVWGDATEVLEYLGNLDFHSQGVG